MQNAQNVNLGSKFNYRWNLADGYPAKGIKKHGKTVFSTFACGGGSTMGYKLAGYDVIGANDIDPQMAKVYKANHHPKHFFQYPIKDLLKIELPKEFYNLDILDGSPPCSVFSTAGLRERAWQVDKKFREGQSKQVLDDLFFDYIDLLAELKPKVGIAENVSGMLKGNAKGYLLQIKDKAKEAGYYTQLFLLNAATMGVPQKRERVFFVFTQDPLKLCLNFKETPIPFQIISDESDQAISLSPLYCTYWDNVEPGQAVGKFKSKRKQKLSLPLATILASSGAGFHPRYKREINNLELKLGGSFPLDYDFLDIVPGYLIGMSVPPVMMAQVADQVYLQILQKQT